MHADGFPLKVSMAPEHTALGLWREGFLWPNQISNGFWASRFRGIRSEYALSLLIPQGRPIDP